METAGNMTCLTSKYFLHFERSVMKHTKLLALLLSTAFAAGCAATKSDPGSQTASSRSTGQVVDDAAITAKIRAALLADPEVSALKVNVDTNQGAVKLKGEIKSLALRKKVEQIAKGVAGVRSVDNQLIVTG
jgi:hyperosmotically inducible protein